MDHPANRYTFPVALFDQHLALLQHRLESLDVVFESDQANLLFPQELKFHSAAHEFIAVATVDYLTEKEQMKALFPVLREIFENDPVLQYEVPRIGRREKQSVKENASITKFNAAYLTTIQTDEAKITRVIFELKTNVGEGDLLSQMTKGYSEEVYGFKVCISFAWLLLCISQVNLAVTGQELLRVDVFPEDLRCYRKTHSSYIHSSLP